MTQAATRILTVGVVSAVGWIAGGVMLAAGLAAVTGVGLWLAGCRHPGPLALLPPIVDDAGQRQPARWCCHDCGATWPTALDDVAAPVQRFAGFDAKKAAEAARRATDLERRQRELAIRRAGLTPREAVSRHPAAIKLQRPVALRSRRAG